MSLLSFDILASLAWRVSFLMAFGMAIAVLMKRRSAAERHLIWTLTILGACLLPLAYLRPPVAIPVTVQAARSVSVDAPTGASVRMNNGLSPAIIWLGGALLVLAYRIAGRVRLAYMVRDAQPIGCSLADDVAHELGIGRNVLLLESQRHRLPMTWGVLKPVVLLPAVYRNWTADRLRVVLVHELGHIRRLDSLTQAMAGVFCALYWFHPLAWFAARRLKQEQEKACDDLVLQNGCRASQYAEHLLDIAEWAGAQRVPPAAIAMAQRSTLESRIRAALDPRMLRQRPARRHALALASVVTAILVTAAGVTMVAQQSGGRLYGTVLDISGAAVPDSEVMVTLAGGNRKEVTRSGADGDFSFSVLPEGTYTVEVRRPGFAAFTKDGVGVKANVANRFNAVLQLGKVAETLTVVGRKPAVAATPASPTRTPSRIRIGGAVQATKVLNMVKPVYPEALQQTGVEGTVLMRGVISTEGKLLSLESMNSLVHPDLVKAATDAVSQWQYQPSLLNGVPVEIVTTITVNFKLGEN